MHPKKVLIVCLGNICRSPTAEAVLRAQAARAGLPLAVDSAGTADYHIGCSPDARSVRHAATRG
jgi:protein-tyrosine-phosphatase